MTHYWWWRLWLHRLGAFFVLTSTLFYGGYALIRMKHIKDDVHAPLGVIVTVLIVFLVISGLIAVYALDHYDTKDYKLALNYRYLHRAFGRLMLILGHVTVVFGIYSYYRNRDQSSNLPYIAAFSTLGVVIILEY